MPAETFLGLVFALGHPEERGAAWARNPERMRQLKEQRLEAEQMLKRQPNHR